MSAAWEPCFTILLTEFATDVSVQLFIEWAELVKQMLQILGQGVVFPIS